MDKKQKQNMCYDEIGLCYQNVDNIMGFMVDTLHLEGFVCLLERIYIYIYTFLLQLQDL